MRHAHTHTHVGAGMDIPDAHGCFQVDGALAPRAGPLRVVLQHQRSDSVEVGQRDHQLEPAPLPGLPRFTGERVHSG